MPVGCPHGRRIDTRGPHKAARRPAQRASAPCGGTTALRSLVLCGVAGSHSRGAHFLSGANGIDEESGVPAHPGGPSSGAVVEPIGRRPRREHHLKAEPAGEKVGPHPLRLRRVGESSSWPPSSMRVRGGKRAPVVPLICFVMQVLGSFHWGADSLARAVGSPPVVSARLMAWWARP